MKASVAVWAVVVLAFMFMGAPLWQAAALALIPAAFVQMAVSYK